VAIYEATSVRITLNGVDIVGAGFDADGGLPFASRPIAPARAMWTTVPGSVLDDLLALHDPEPRRARNFDGRLAWLTRKHAAERRVIREWLSRAWDGSWQRGAPLPLP